MYEPGDAIKWIYFPCDCIVSRVYTTEDGHSAEISVVGNDGIVGIAVVLGGDSTPSRMLVQSAGYALRMRAEPFKTELNHRDGELRELLLRYVQTLILQMAQTAVCNRHHSIAQQLARWILLSLDRLPSNELTMTQELIANMLGVRREGVTEAAKKLQELAIIGARNHHRTSRLYSQAKLPKKMKEMTAPSIIPAMIPTIVNEKNMCQASIISTAPM